MPALIGSRRASRGLVPCAQAREFLARTTNFDQKHRRAYIRLINGLVKDGIWPRLDVLYIFATQDETVALLNLKSSSFAATKQNSPTFTADQGFTGLASANNNILVPSFTGYPQFTRNNCHVSLWEYSSRPASNVSQLRQNGISWIITRNTSDLFSVVVTAGGMTAANTESRGHFMGHRTASDAEAGYINGVEVVTSNAASGALGAGTGAVPDSTSTATIAMFSLGLSLAGLQAAFYSRLRTYMNAVDVP
jgi:hypothetical protein